MSAYLNRVEIIGHLGNDPVSRFTPTGKQVVQFNLAANRQRTDDSGTKTEITTWVRCEAWNGMAKTIAEYMKKGRFVFVAGYLDNDNFTGKDGVKRYFTKLVVQDCQFLDKAPESNGMSKAEYAADINEGFPF